MKLRFTQVLYLMYCQFILLHYNVERNIVECYLSLLMLSSTCASSAIKMYAVKMICEPDELGDNKETRFAVMLARLHSQSKLES